MLVGRLARANKVLKRVKIGRNDCDELGVDTGILQSQVPFVSCLLWGGIWCVWTCHFNASSYLINHLCWQVSSDWVGRAKGS